MSADMSIHALDHLDEESFKCFFSNEIGSSYEDALYTCPEGKTDTAGCSHRQTMINSPQIAVGEVSWLKAALLEDSQTFVPDTIGAISEILDEPTRVTPEIIEKLTQAFDLPNHSDYPIPHPGLKRAQVRRFLTDHQGHYAFIISW